MGPSGPLGVASQGGQQLSDRYGALPVDGSSIYLDPYTGERLAVDAGFSAGDVVGDPKVYGALSATVAGTPATRRRSGWDQLDLTHGASTGHFFLTLTEDRHTFTGRVNQQADPGVENLFFGVDPADNRWGLQVVGKNSAQVRLFEDAVLRTNPAISGPSVFGAGKTYTLAGSADSDGNTAIYAWDGAGALISTNSDTYAGGVVSLEGSYAVGRGRAEDVGGFPSGNLAAFLVWDGSTESQLTLANVEADLRSGTDIDTIAGTYGASIASDGMICGGYSRTATDLLFTLSGAGAKPTAAVIPSRTTYTQPTDLAGLVGDWDTYRDPLYDGSGLMNGIRDYGPSGLDMTVATPAQTASSASMLGRSVTLPGRAGSAGEHYGEAAVTGTLGDFTLCFIVPTWQDSSSGAEGDCLFSIGATSGAPNIRIRTDSAPGSEGTIHAVDHLGNEVASIQTGYSSTTGSAANALLFVRRDTTAGSITLDCWHFDDNGGATVKETQATAPDSTFRASFAMDGVALGGEIGATSGQWSGLLHRVAMYSRTLSNAEILSVAQGFAARVGMDGVT